MAISLRKTKASDIWLPPLHAKQQLAFDSKANEILYGGSTRGGKSHFSRISLILWCTAIAGLQTDIFRLHHDDVVGNHMKGLNSFPDLLAEWERDKLVQINQTEIKFLFNGSNISLEHCHDDKVMLKHQGIGKHVRIFEEATQIPERRIRWLRAWVTMPQEMKLKLPDQLRTMYPFMTDAELMELFPKILFTSNPIGVSANYFRKHFVHARPRYEIGRSSDTEGGFLRQYVPAKVEDNPSEDAKATRRRVLGMGDAAISNALLNEDWEQPTGDFYPEWDEDRHIVPDLEPPAHLFKFRTFDWGSAEPFAVGWWCVADGTEIKLNNGQMRWFPSGALICYREWYGCNPEKTDEGLRMRNHDIAQGILNRTPEATSNITLTDSYPFSDRGETNARNVNKKFTIADAFADCGVPLMRANTARHQGWSQLRDRLIGIENIALIYWVESCSGARDYFPVLPRHPTNAEDAAESGESTHICDIARYAAASRPLTKKQPVDKDIKSETTTPRGILARINPPRRNHFKRR